MPWLGKQLQGCIKLLYMVHCNSEFCCEILAMIWYLICGWFPIEMNMVYSVCVCEHIEEEQVSF